jgi:hypothetical protein
METPSSTYEIYIGYDDRKHDLAKTFTSLGKIIEGDQVASSILLGFLGADETQKIVMSDIQKSSIHVFLTNVLRNTDLRLKNVFQKKLCFKIRR